MTSLGTKNWSPTVLVLGPGGVKGFLELGALLVFEREKILERIRHYVGVSVGAVISLLLVAGYSVSEIITEALEVNIFQDISTINIAEAKANSGLISNRVVKDLLLQRLEEKFGFVPTLGQLYSATGVLFTIVTMNLDKDRAEYISKETDPNLSAVDAVMLSMNIPLLFYKIKHKGCVCIDGAFGDPYPVGEYDDGNTDILGIYIVTRRPDIASATDSNFLLYLYKIIDSTMTYSRYKTMQRASDRCRHLELVSPTFDTVGLTVDTKAKNAMIIHGYREAEKFLFPAGEQSTENEDVDKIVYDGSDRVETEATPQEGANVLSEMTHPEQQVQPSSEATAVEPVETIKRGSRQRRGRITKPQNVDP